MTNPKQFTIDLKPHPASEQWKKSPCFVERYEAQTGQDGKTVYVKVKRNLEATDPQTQEKRQLKLDEAKGYVEAVSKKTVSNITEEEAENVTDILDTYTPDSDPVILEELEAQLKSAAELGLGCPSGCGRFFILKANQNSDGYLCTNALLKAGTLFCDQCGAQIRLEET